MAQRTKIQQTAWNEVTLTYFDSEVEQVRTRVFWVPRTSHGTGYVREGSQDGDARQVCDGLLHSGNTLECSPEGLLDLIRTEWRAYRSLKKAEMDALSRY